MFKKIRQWFENYKQKRKIAKKLKELKQELMQKL